MTAILQDPAVTGAVEEIRTLLQEVTEVLSQLSFASVTDEVIALIEQMEQGLRALQSTDLNDALKGLLETALAVLPPISDRLPTRLSTILAYASIRGRWLCWSRYGRSLARYWIAFGPSIPEL